MAIRNMLALVRVRPAGPVKKPRFAKLERKHQVGRLRHYFPGTQVGVRYLSADELVRLADRLVEREARIRGRAGREIPKRCEP